MSNDQRPADTFKFDQMNIFNFVVYRMDELVSTHTHV